MQAGHVPLNRQKGLAWVRENQPSFSFANTIVFLFCYGSEPVLAKQSCFETQISHVRTVSVFSLSYIRRSAQQPMVGASSRGGISLRRLCGAAASGCEIVVTTPAF